MSSSYDSTVSDASIQREQSLCRGLMALAWVLAGIRFLRLGRWSLWYDEALTLGDGWHGAGWLPDKGPVHMLGYMVIRLVADPFPGRPDEFALRFGPALAGFLCVPATAWAFGPLAGRRRAVLAALLVACSSWQVYWSQNARAYTFAELGSLLAAGIWVRGWLADSRWRCGLGVALAGMAGLFHPHAVCLAVGLGLGPWLARKLRAPAPGGDPGKSADLGGLAMLVLGGVLAAPLFGPALMEYIPKKAAGESQGLLGFALENLVHLATSTGFQMTPLLLVAAGLGAVLAARSVRGRVVILVTLLPVLCVALVALVARVSAQYLFSLLPWVALLAAWPVGSEREPAPSGLHLKGRTALGFGALLILPGLASCALLLGPRMGERPRWREAYTYVWSARGENDLVLGMQAGLGEYYVDPLFTDIRRPVKVGWCDRTRAHNVRAATRTGRPLWLVVRPDFLQLWPAEQRRAFEGLLQDECRLMRRYPVPLEGRDLELLVYYRPGDV